MLSPELQAAGARQASARAPEQITLDWLQSECSRLERVLRLQFPDGKLDPHDERVLASYKPLADTTRAMRAWAYLKHLYLCRTERRARASEDAAGAKEAARALLRRDAVAVELANGRIVHVTSRSYLAAYAIARHWTRIQELHATLVDVEGAIERVNAERAAARWLSANRSRLRRHAKKLEGVFITLYAELAAQRRALYAHAFTKDGAPATSAAQAPAWWEELGPDDDAALIAGIAAAGMVRWATVAEAKKADPDPTPSADSRAPKPWQYGWGVFFATLEKEQDVEPAAFYGRDVYQLLAWVEQLPDHRPKEKP